MSELEPGDIVLSKAEQGDGVASSIGQRGRGTSSATSSVEQGGRATSPVGQEGREMFLSHSGAPCSKKFLKGRKASSHTCVALIQLSFHTR